MPTRRDFLTLTAASLALAATARAHARTPRPQPPTPLNILILGGTSMLGPALVSAALARNHRVTTFNRGLTAARRNLTLPPEVTQLTGDRDPRKPPGLTALEGLTFDAAIDTSGLYPRHVATSAALLNRQGLPHYVFISSISAYASHANPRADESDPTADPENPYEEEGDPGFVYTGELKRPCETAALRIFGDRATIIRPAYLVGPGDATGRFAYWPLRVREAVGDHTDMLVPDRPTLPIQVVDVRDLAAWTIHTVEQRTTGIFNACGPATPHTLGDVLRACEEATGNSVPRAPRYHWVTWDFLRQHRAPLPIVLPDTGPYAGFHTRLSDKARAAGLTFRPLRQTIDAILQWFDAQPPDTQPACRGLPTLAREAELLAAWHNR